ncbi:hypothetical protein KRP69_05745 [Mammaliicoccus sciuri]|nr:hypothetical protein [Staphylococcus sp. EG-SA-13]MCC2088714.1 hypothetical protein [Mammaliicoccus sciuri]
MKRLTVLNKDQNKVDKPVFDELALRDLNDLLAQIFLIRHQQLSIGNIAITKRLNVRLISLIVSVTLLEVLEMEKNIIGYGLYCGNRVELTTSLNTYLICTFKNS